MSKTTALSSASLSDMVLTPMAAKDRPSGERATEKGLGVKPKRKKIS
jgi:hypothetical protein